MNNKAKNNEIKKTKLTDLLVETEIIFLLKKYY